MLAETFTDIEAFEGTCYKAAAWQPCGITKGFTREHRADYFFRNNRPKKLWLRVLHRNAGPMLCSIEMPPQYKQLESLRDVLREVPDPRARNRSFPCSSLLLLVAMALLAGCKSLASIQRYGQLLTPKQRATLDWPSNRAGTFRPAPSYSIKFFVSHFVTLFLTVGAYLFRLQKNKRRRLIILKNILLRNEKIKTSEA